MSNPFAARMRAQDTNQQPIRSCLAALAVYARFGLFAAFLLWVVAFSLPRLHAQVQNGTIEGVVTDTAGAVVPDASVTVRQLATNLTLHNQTNEVGIYSLPQLLPGEYSVTVERPGLKKSVIART